MASAGLAMSDGQIIVAVIINGAVQLHRVKTLNEAKDILDTSKPDIVGVDKSAESIFSDVSYGFKVIKVNKPVENDLGEAVSKLIMLNITRPTDKPAIYAADFAAKNA